MRLALIILNASFAALGLLVLLRSAEWPAVVLGAVMFIVGCGMFGLLIISTDPDPSRMVLYVVGGIPSFLGSAGLALFGAYALTLADDESARQLTAFWSIVIGLANIYYLIRVMLDLRAQRSR